MSTQDRRARRLWELVFASVFAALVLLGLTLIWYYNEPQPDGYPYGCSRWIAECALKRSVLECRADAERLGCR